MARRVFFFCVVEKAGAEYGVDVTAEFSPECPPVPCSNPDHPAYADPGCGAELDVIEAKVVEYPDLDEPHGTAEGRVPIGQDMSHLLSSEDVDAMVEEASMAWQDAEEAEVEAAAEARMDMMREEGFRFGRW